MDVVLRPGFTRRFLKNPSSVAGFVLFILVLLVAALADALFPGDPLEMVAQPFIQPLTDNEFPLGTDLMGRDIASGIFHGARVSLMIGLVSTFVSLIIGIGVGAFAGYYGGLPGAVFMRITELFQTIPPFLFALALVSILQPSIVTIVFAIGITSWPSLARLVRAEVMKLRHGELVQASITLGASDTRIIFLHILPNVLTPIVVSTSILAAGAILTESAFAFLGLGDPNVVSWGGMIGAGREVLRTDWYVATIPGLFVIVSVLALNLLGDGLNDALNLKARRA
ncbi:MAG: ABC transporter permease [Deltaproteobacteria bacterium]|jgi:peptide/nickel transport system permease protein|nr:ABC transporter permease [Deltaproteobacteria bacterium]